MDSLSETARPKKSLGQHFLRDETYCHRIVAWLGLTPGDTVVEIGPGTGQLTGHLLRAGARVVAVEFDRDMTAILGDRFEHLPRKDLIVIQSEILRFPWTSLPVQGPCHLVGNLPFNIATRVIRKTALEKERFQSCTFMLQKEVAERILASPGCRDYGFFSVLTQQAFTASRGFDVPPGAFYPPPKVVSHVLKLVPRREAPELDLVAFERLLKSSFKTRRKTILNNLKSSIDLSSRQLRSILGSCGIGPNERPEEIGVEAFVCLSRLLQSEGIRDGSAP